MSNISRKNSSNFGANLSRDYKSFQDFIRASYVNVYGEVTQETYRSYFKEKNKLDPNTQETRKTAANILDGLPIYQLKAWSIRNLRRLKYSQPNVGIDTMVHHQSEKLEKELNELIINAGDELDLNPHIEIPSYYKYVDFHQQPGGVWRDDIDGLIYDYGRATTNPNQSDPNQVYYNMWDKLPSNKQYEKVLDWGTGHGGGIIAWMLNNPHSKGYGVDISAPCLKLAHVRAKEAGVKVKFSQQDIAKLNYKDNFFDMIFHMFMLHELPQKITPSLFEEACRVLKPGGIFIGMELALLEGVPSQHILLQTDTWLNNEPYMASCVDADYKKIARDAGFSNVDSIKVVRNTDAMGPIAKDIPPKATWNYYVFEK